jgi:predicted TIM-barrel fold metal-dependent hydrolase
MYSGRIIDAHIHLWDPRTTPRTVTPLVKALGWSRPVLKRVAGTVVPSTAMAFVGTPDQVLSPYLPGMWWNDTSDAAVDGFVHIQADWQSRDPLGQAEETRWLESLCGRDLLAVVGRADLAHARLDAVLDAHVEASPRFRGIRDYLAHGGEDAGLMSFASSPDRTAEHAWRRGYDRLGERGLTFDAWTYADQLPRFERLVADHPDTPVVLCHLGSPVGAGGPFAGHGRSEADRTRLVGRWREDVAAIAAHDHVHVKLSGLGMPIIGWGWHDRATPPGVEEVADAYGPFVEHVLQTVGPQRCMIASNFPMDRVSLPWTTLFEAFTRLTAGLPEQHRHAVFHGTAARFYACEGMTA